MSAATAFAQKGAFSNLHRITTTIRPEIQLIDSLDLVPESIVCRCLISNDTLPANRIKSTTHTIKIDTSGLDPDCIQLEVTFRTLPFSLGKTLFRFDSTAWRRADWASIPIEFDFGQAEKQSASLWQTPGLNTSGAYTRGFALGNSQNLTFNSDLNLQLAGKLGNDIEVNAAIADNSVPIQPDGSTRNIQEFDRIYVQLKRKQTSLLAGDFELSQAPGSYFTRYYKKLQGANISTQTAIPKLFSKGNNKSVNPTDSLRVRVGAAISRGKFNRTIIQGQEGNQGPYRLQGAEGERFIIILAGTEKVFIDGQLMRRGLEDDYIIDYNLGELSFTARRLITKDVRIIIEFEYVVQNYLRTTLTSDAEWTHGKQRFYLSTYSEQDNPNTSGIQQLSPSARNLLASVGDSITNAYSTGIDTLADGFDPSRILYKWVDTLICGTPGRVLAYSSNRDSAILTVRWSEVPFGQGNYQLSNSAANGRVYQWVAPDASTCQPQGNYEPVTKLTAPEQKQVFAVGAEIKPTKNSRYAIETALSNRNINRFSNLDKSDDYGLGLAVSGKQSFDLGKNKMLRNQNESIAIQADFEYAQARFRPVNPYRAAEFVRDWNTEQLSEPRTEQIMRAGVDYRLGAQTTINYTYSRFDRQGNYLGNKHLARLATAYQGFSIKTEMNELQTTGVQGRTSFSRPKIELAQMFSLRQISLSASDSTHRSTEARSLRRPFLQVGIYAEREKNPRYTNTSNDLLANSFWYDLARAFVRMPEQKSGLQWEASRSRRLDFAPQAEQFLQATSADEFAWKGSYTPAAKAITHRINWNLAQRQLRITEPQLSNQTGQTTWLGRVDYGFTAVKNALNLNTGYEIGSGQNPKLEFTYIQVNPGEGVYTWIDRNQDSVLTVDEMEISVFQDQASYIRLAVTTNQFVQTNNLAFNQNLRFEPRVLWAKKKGVLKQLSKFSVQSSWQVNRKTKEGAAAISPWNPFEFSVADTSLVSISASGRQSLYFQRAHPRFEASLSQSKLRNRFVATTGFESRGQDEWIARTRMNPKPEWTLDLFSGAKAIRSDVENFDNRDYQIREYSGGPELTWLYKRSFRSGLNYHLVSGQNRIGTGEKTEKHNLSCNLAYQPVAKRTASGAAGLATSLRGQVTLASIRYSGAANTPISFVMLEGLQNGRNYLWNLSLDRQLSKYLQMNITYEGRKPGVGKVVHVARAQVRALF